MTETNETSDDSAVVHLVKAAEARRQARKWWLVVGGLLGVAVLIDLARAPAGRSR